MDTKNLQDCIKSNLDCRKLLDSILQEHTQEELLEYFIRSCDCCDTIRDILCSFCDINNCWPNET